MSAEAAPTLVLVDTDNCPARTAPAWAGFGTLELFGRAENVTAWSKACGALGLAIAARQEAYPCRNGADADILLRMGALLAEQAPQWKCVLVASGDSIFEPAVRRLREAGIDAARLTTQTLITCAPRNHASRRRAIDKYRLHDLILGLSDGTRVRVSTIGERIRQEGFDVRGKLTTRLREMGYSLQENPGGVFWVTP